MKYEDPTANVKAKLESVNINMRIWLSSGKGDFGIYSHVNILKVSTLAEGIPIIEQTAHLLCVHVRSDYTLRADEDRRKGVHRLIWQGRKRVTLLS